MTARWKQRKPTAPLDGALALGAEPVGEFPARASESRDFEPPWAGGLEE